MDTRDASGRFLYTVHTRYKLALFRRLDQYLSRTRSTIHVVSRERKIFLRSHMYRYRVLDFTEQYSTVHTPFFFRRHTMVYVASARSTVCNVTESPTNNIKSIVIVQYSTVQYVPYTVRRV